MSLSPLHESHIRRVAVSFVLSSPDLDPKAVSAELALQADASARRGDTRWNVARRVLGPQEQGWWQLGTAGRVQSKDVNEHFRHLLSLLIPRQDAIARLVPGGEAYFDVLWESTYLYAGTGPVLSWDVIAGVAALEAGIGFDIYQINEPRRSRGAGLTQYWPQGWIPNALRSFRGAATSGPRSLPGADCTGDAHRSRSPGAPQADDQLPPVGIDSSPVDGGGRKRARAR